MCGIFGVIRPTGITPGDRTAFNAIGAHLKHRGPDGDGFIDESAALLGMHRLSIVDVEHGWQPFWSEDERIGVLGNGEIYNARSLARSLVSRGHRLTSQSDMEVVPHLFEEFGLSFVEQLRGMFALVVFDRDRREVHLIRDRMGEKPISVAKTDRTLFFASEQSALVAGGVSQRKIDPSALAQYLLHGFSPEPDSLIEGIHKVPAGYVLTINLKDLSTREVKYWDPLDYLGSASLSSAKLEFLMEDAVAAALTSDVPVGVALSGGLDSSLVAAIASRSETEVQVFSAGYPESAFDESAEARQLANGLGLRFHRVEIETQQVGRSYAEVTRLRDEPIADLAGPALAAVARASRDQGVPVLLTGLGGDELFWGYEWVRDLARDTHEILLHPHSLARNFMPSMPPKGRQGQYDWLLSGAGILKRHRLWKVLTRGVTAVQPPLPLYQFQYGAKSIAKFIASIGLPQPDDGFCITNSPDSLAGDYLNAMLQTYLRVNGLGQLDRLAMACSVESRVPLVDHHIVEAVMGSALGSQSYNQAPKHLLRQTASAILPGEVLNRPKRGFTPPVRDWLSAIWTTNQDCTGMDATLEMIKLPARRLHSAVAQPIKPTGQVDQIALRLMTLELWARGQA